VETADDDDGVAEAETWLAMVVDAGKDAEVAAAAAAVASAAAVAAGAEDDEDDEDEETPKPKSKAPNCSSSPPKPLFPPGISTADEGIFVEGGGTRLLATLTR